MGRLSREKGVIELVRAFADAARVVESARLEILGDGPLRSRVEAEIVATGSTDRVRVHGWVDRPTLDRVLAGAWAVVVPSIWEEPLGLVALEAIVRGVPVVASASGGLPEVVEHGRTGMLVPPGSVEQLAAALRQIMSGAMFPDHRVDPRASAELARRHDPAVHADWLRGILGQVAA